ncbi:hypothetical protein [Actinomadura sp. NPDC048394]|jgi:hypothetical protein|uniref:hypothetical protein n=1 Tax=Actinomadura sp. NPDC048394 TaxID=3158223 RepID=UPI0033EB29A5
MPQPQPDAPIGQVFVTLALIAGVVIVVLGLFVLIGYVVHRTADSPSGRTVAILTAIGSVIVALPPILYTLPRIYGG